MTQCNIGAPYPTSLWNTPPMMKQTLIALAALGASGMAAAQSSVTLYGVADAGLGRINRPLTGRADPVTGVQAQAIDPTTSCLLWDNKTRFISGAMMNNADSRIGFTGVEDIGGGGKVGFQFETGINLEDGRTTTDTFWARQANVFVGGNWGTIKAGRQFTPSFLAQGAYELTGLANYSALANTYGVVGVGFRASSALAYVTPNMNGFQAAAAFVSKNNPEGAPFGKNVWDLGVMYAGGPLGVGFSVNKGADGGKTNYQLGAKYSFGNFALAASYQNVSSNALRERTRRGFSLGGQAQFGAFTVTLDVTRDTRNQWTGAWAPNATNTAWTWNNKKYTNAVLEAKYAMSKRTFLYGAVLRLDGATNWGVGINHSF